MELTVSYRDKAATSVTTGVIDFTTANGRLETKQGYGADGFVVINVDGQSYLGTTRPAAGGPSWVKAPAVTNAASMRSAFDSATLVDQLKQSASTVTQIGTARIHGAPTVTYRLDLTTGARLLPLLQTPATTAAKATMDVDADGRLRRLVVEPTALASPDGHALPVPVRSELDLWDYGVPVTVTAPPPADVVPFDDARAGDVLGVVAPGAAPSGASDAEQWQVDHPNLTGPFARLASGRWEDVSWEIWAANTADGRKCLTFERVPPPQPQDPSPVGVGMPNHNGSDATCAPDADMFRRGDPVQLIGDWSDEAAYWSAAGTVAPGISALDVDLANGRTLHVPVDPATHVFTLFSRTAIRITRVRPDAGSGASITCTPDDEGGYGLASVNCSGSVGH